MLIAAGTAGLILAGIIFIIKDKHGKEIARVNAENGSTVVVESFDTKKPNQPSPKMAAVPAKPIVPAKPVPLDLKPDAKAWDLKPGSPLNPASLVLKPAAIKGLRSWTLEICASRGGGGSRSTQPG